MREIIIFVKRFILRHITYIILCIAITKLSFGQQKKIQYNPGFDKQLFHMGFTLGFNSLDYRISPSYTLLYQSTADTIYRIETQQTLGVNLGIVSDLRIFEYLNVRFLPGMIFGQRNLEYKLRNFAYPDEMKFYTYSMKIPSIYLDAPITFKYRSQRVNNYRPYIIGGVALKYDLETKRVGRNNSGYTIQQNPLDYYYEFGFGIDWYLVYFKLSTEFKYSFGTKDIIVKENIQYSTVIDKLRSRMFILSFHFE